MFRVGQVIPYSKSFHLCLLFFGELGSVLLFGKIVGELLAGRGLVVADFLQRACEFFAPRGLLFAEIVQLALDFSLIAVRDRGSVLIEAERKRDGDAHDARERETENHLQQLAPPRLKRPRTERPIPLFHGGCSGRRTGRAVPQ